jgi:coenzyme F420-reducing hydrogenase beta subunit
LVPSIVALVTARVLLREHVIVNLIRLQFVARTKEDVLKAKGVKPTLSPNLDTLATVEALDVKRLLFIGVGCQV